MDAETVGVAGCWIVLEQVSVNTLDQSFDIGLDFLQGGVYVLPACL